MDKHGGVLSKHERRHLEDLMTRVDLRCWKIREHSTSGQLPALYWSMVNCYWACEHALNPN